MNTLFDAMTGEELKAAALVQVEQNANTGWMMAARLSICSVAKYMPTFTTDDVWNNVEGSGEVTHEPRAMGAVMRWATREGLCVPTDRYEKSSRPECHARPVRVWRSTSRPENTR